MHRAKTWQVGCFALNDVAINFYWMLMTFMAFYLQGVLGLTVALASFLLAALNIFELFATKGAMIANAIIFFALVFLDPTTLDFSVWTVFTTVFFIGLAVRGGFMTVGSRIVIPMIADCADHEVYRTGKYVPGTISGLFTFVDKIFGSLNVLIVGLLLILAGYGYAFPTPDTPQSTAIFVIAMICYVGLPMLGWIINLVALRFYDLTPEKMEEIREAAVKIKAIQEDI